MSCPDEETIVGLFRGTLTPQDTAAVDEHLDECSGCRELVAQLARTSLATRGPLALDLTGGPDAAPPARGSFRLEPGTEVGRYAILGLVGFGGMGAVYAAYDPQLDRRIALKVLRTDLAGEDAAGDLLREAQALARLDHPNVVSVHDVGTFEDQVFLAMEFIDGDTLGDLIGRGSYSWRQILDLFVAAGKGLAAAHEASLVHGDFKPANVLVDKRGRVRVVDFGLARKDGAPVVNTPEGAAHESHSGAAAGTPAYMAPEQHEGGPVDARADQFSYCVALSEALFGTRPFRGHSETELQIAKTEGRWEPDTTNSSVPAWLTRALERGMSPRPDDRFPTMDALLSVLARPDASRRRWLGAAAALAALAAVLLVPLLLSSRSAELCSGARQSLARAWDPQREARLQRAFLGSGATFAKGSWSRTRAALDDYAGRWSATHEWVCRATRVWAQRDEAALQLGMRCLSRRLTEMRALTEVFAAADRKVVLQGPKAVRTLKDPDDCRDLARLERVSRAKKIRGPLRDKLEASIARARALHSAGRFDSGLAAARTTVVQAEKAADPGLLAQTLLTRGVLETAAGHFKIAAKTLRTALWRALSGGDDEALVDASVYLTRVLGYRLGKTARAEMWSHHAAAALERIPNDRLRRAELESARGALRVSQGRLRNALGHLQRSLAIRRGKLGLDHPLTLESLNDVGLLQKEVGQTAAALGTLSDCLARRRRVLGGEHPAVSETLVNLGGVYHRQGRYEKALEHYRRALKVRLTALGPHHPDVIVPLISAGSALGLLGRYEEALRMARRAYEIQKRRSAPNVLTFGTLLTQGALLSNMGRHREALAVLGRNLRLVTAKLGPGHRETALHRSRFAAALAQAGRFRESLEHHRQAISAYERAGGRHSASLAPSVRRYAAALLASGRTGEAMNTAQRAVDLSIKTRGPKHPTTARAFLLLGEISLRRGRHREALGQLERALKIFVNRRSAPDVMARTRFNLARALWHNGKTGRALALGREALASYRKLGRWFVKRTRAVARWLRARKRSG